MDIDFEVDPSKAARGDLMSSLNKGADVTKGLKKVSDDQKTHKNPALRSTGAVPAKVCLMIHFLILILILHTYYYYNTKIPC